MPRRHHLTLLVALLLAPGVAACSDSSGPDGDETITIEMRTGNVFSPASPTIDAGTTVRWINEDAVAHNTTSTTAGLWASSNLAQGGTFQRTFGTAGSFPYQCTLHPGMTGTITVR